MTEPTIRTLSECDEIVDTRERLFKQWNVATGIVEEVGALSSRVHGRAGPVFVGPIAAGTPAEELAAAATLVKGRLAKRDQIKVELQKKHDEVKAVRIRGNVTIGMIAIGLVVAVVLLLNFALNL